MNGVNRSVLIVSGGTGGHIFPALVFGSWLERNLGASVSYLSGSRPVEAEIYASAGVSPFRLSLEGSPLGVRSPGRMLKRSLALLSAFGEASRCLREVGPSAVFLFGGYVSLVPLLLCRLRKIPVVIHEQNAVAGRVTRLASRLGAVITTGWEECVGLRGPWTPVGIPVREPRRLPRQEALSRLGLSLPEGSRVVGVAMGSLGAGHWRSGYWRRRTPWVQGSPASSSSCWAILPRGRCRATCISSAAGGTWILFTPCATRWCAAPGGPHWRRP